MCDNLFFCSISQLSCNRFFYKVPQYHALDRFTEGRIPVFCEEKLKETSFSEVFLRLRLL